MAYFWCKHPAFTLRLVLTSQSICLICLRIDQAIICCLFRYAMIYCGWERDNVSRIEELEKVMVRDNEFMLSVGRMITCMKNNDLNGVKEAHDRAASLCQPGVVGRLQQIFDKHKYIDRLHATPESVAFVKSVKLM